MDRKLIYFLVGFTAFYFLYYRFVLEPMDKETRARKTVTTPLKEAQPSPKPAAPQAAPAASAPQTTQTQVLATSPVQTKAKPRKILVETPLYRAEFSNQGGVLTSFRLKKYRDDFGGPLEMIPQVAPGQDAPMRLDFEDKDLARIANEAVYQTDENDISIQGSEKAELELTYSNGAVSFKKHFEFHAGGYLIDSLIEARKEESVVPVRVSWSPGLESLKSYKKAVELHPSRGLVNNGEKVEHLEPKKIKDFQKVGSTVKWAGVENNYFLAIFIPGSHQPTDAYMVPTSAGEQKESQHANVLIGSSRAEPLRMQLLIAPKDYLLLRELGMDLQNAVDFGFFGPVAKGLFFTLRYFYGFTKNYGWAIVLLTILIKIIFTPFTQMSFASMKKMQQMQPELKKIQERYSKLKSDDPRKQNMNVEIMQLHKRYGVNPLGGCLPMLVQMPVLIAFWKVLNNAIELRQAPFGLWLQDLSQPDPLMITPVLMGGSMLLQQKMTPASDPMQQRMMYIMPVMFTFMSFKFPSGLVVYWLLSNLLAIGHQYYFQKQQKIPTTSPA